MYLNYKIKIMRTHSVCKVGLLSIFCAIAQPISLACNDLFMPIDVRYDTKYAERFFLKNISNERERMQFRGYHVLPGDEVVFYIEIGSKYVMAKLNEKNIGHGFSVKSFDSSSKLIAVEDFFESKTSTLKLGEISIKDNSAQIMILDSKTHKLINFSKKYEMNQIGAGEAVTLANFDIENHSVSLIYECDGLPPVLFFIKVADYKRDS